MVTAQAVINLPALVANYQYLKKYCDNRPLIAVVKGEAYGHGVVEVSAALSMADMLAVARIEEAVEIREAGITTPILLLEGCYCDEDLHIAAKYDFQVVIHHQFQVDQFKSLNLPKAIKVWLKLDTGMHRIGIHPNEAESVIQTIEKSTNLDGTLNYLSHFSCADELDSDVTVNQIKTFRKITQQRSGLKSIANSAGILFWPDSHFDMARTGIALYGVSPAENYSGKELGLTAVMTIKSRLIAIRQHEANEPVGYGQIWHSHEATKIGVIAFGYGDGYPRLAPEGTPIWLNGRLVPIVGRVSMDMITVDLGSDCDDQIGDEVELWGSRLPIEVVAKAIGTIPYELTIKLTKRVVRQYISI